MSCIMILLLYSLSVLLSCGRSSNWIHNGGTHIANTQDTNDKLQVHVQFVLYKKKSFPVDFI